MYGYGRGRTVRVLAMGGIVVASVFSFAAGGSAAGAAGSAAPVPVIIVLKDQQRGLPATRVLAAARRDAIAHAQAPIATQLSVSGAREVHSYTLLNAISATVSGSEESQLRADPAVQEVVPDQVIHMGAAAQQLGAGTAGTGTAPVPGECAPRGKVQLNPEALELIHADSDATGAETAHSLGVDGSGVSVGFVADSLDVNNQDFIRANGQHVFSDYKDFTGQGLGVPTGGGEAFLDASSIAAQGRHSYDISQYSALTLNQPCNIRVEGVAPGASLVGLDVLGDDTGSSTSTLLRAVDYAVTVDHVQVLNESWGYSAYPDDPASLDLLKQANDQAVAAGTTVTVSSGDSGFNTSQTPGSDPQVISVGATTSFRLDLQDGYGSAFPAIKGWVDNNIAAFSSSGFLQDGRTVDLVAPGDEGWMLCSTDQAMYGACSDWLGRPAPVVDGYGTSESAPLVAGVAALVIEAYRNSHGGASPSPAVVKEIIESTADDTQAPGDQQGTGLLDAYQAVQAAQSFKAGASTPNRVGQTLLSSVGQLNAVDLPRTPETLSDTITNNGSSRQTIRVSSRTLGTYQQLKSATISLTDGGSQHVLDPAGVSDNYEAVSFTVPQGYDRLRAAIAYTFPPAVFAGVRLTLVDPSGRLTGFSEPVGKSNYGEAQVSDPIPGTWTAYIWCRNSTVLGGSPGPVRFAVGAAKYEPFGEIAPGSLTLAPGQSSTVTLRVSTPEQPGDSSGSIVLDSDPGPGFGHVTTVPVTLRSLIPIGNSTFVDTLSGGNAFASNAGETFYYQLDMPAGRPELNAVVKLADNPDNPFDAWLVSPSGEALAFSANELPSSNDPGYTNQLGAQLHVLSPAAGAWTLIVAFAPTVSGTAISEPFTVATDEGAVPASAPGLPNSAQIPLAAGQAKTYDVLIRNLGRSTEQYFIDARLPVSDTFDLRSTFGLDTTAPLGSSAIPQYLVPTHTTSLSAHASTSGSGAIQFETFGPWGDPDVLSDAGTAVSAVHSADSVTQGLWYILPGVVGAFGAEPAPSEPVATSMTATTSAFDSAVSSPTGDLWLSSVDPAALDHYNPITVAPGQTATIPVTITPAGPPGTTVRGMLYVDDDNSISFQLTGQLNGNEVAAIPYAYRIS